MSSGNEMKPICFYHKDDLDGWCSAAIVYNYYKGECDLFGITHGEKFPWELVRDDEEQIVVMVDYAIDPASMSILAETRNFIWIDHHLSAINDNDINIFGARSTGFAACELTFNFFYGVRPPLSITYLGMYDSWRVLKNYEIQHLLYGVHSLIIA